MRSMIDDRIVTSPDLHFEFVDVFDHFCPFTCGVSLPSLTRGGFCTSTKLSLRCSPNLDKRHDANIS
jgi:hypothetical protein